MYRTGGSNRFRKKRAYINHIDANKKNAGMKKQSNSSIIGVTRTHWFPIKSRWNHDDKDNCPRDVSAAKKIDKWWKKVMLLFGLPYDYVYLYLIGYSIQQLVQITLPNANELSMTQLSCELPNVHCLNQSDFDKGPVIIRESGIYRLETDIVFSPFQENNGKPTEEWLNSLPEDERKAYVLGAFAAIVIRADNVCLDLNGKTFKQSEIHFFQQTFYSHVEMASSPFIMGQGPADFGKDVDEANQVFITNGTFGLSSHHGIHGNLCKNCIFSNLKFENFAVAAIHLNGSHNIVVDNVIADNKNINIKINSLFSQAQFILELLESSEIPDDEYITIQGINKTMYNIKNSLKTDIEEVFDCIKNNQPYPEDKIFFNKGGKLDANLYGLVFNTKGIAIKGFKDMREDNKCGNSNIVLNNVTIKNIESKGTEIKVLSDNTTNDTGAYGSGGFVGPAGDVFDYVKASDENGFYKSNCLSDAQLLAAKYSLNKRVNIPLPMREWAASGTINIEDVINDNEYYVLCNRDSMNHVMKGNIGLFIQQAYRVVANNLVVRNICNTSVSKNVDPASSYGILFSGSKDVLLKNYHISYIKSGENGISQAIAYKKTNENIEI
tara:strand:- start:1011 stop:2834 length:1824 start_codon:yes stop_codon:yes gene_type:complete